MKKKLSLLLALLMVLSLSVTAVFADAELKADYKETQELGTAEIKVITFKTNVETDVEKGSKPRGWADPAEGYAYYNAYVGIRIAWDGKTADRRWGGGGLVFTIKPSLKNDKTPAYISQDNMVNSVSVVAGGDASILTGSNAVKNYVTGTNMENEEANNIFKFRSGAMAEAGAVVKTDEKGNKYYFFELQFSNLLAKEGDQFPLLVEAFVDDKGDVGASWLPTTLTDPAVQVAAVEGLIVIPGEASGGDTPADSVSAGPITAKKDEAITPITATQTGGTEGGEWSATGLPEGVTIDPVTGVISGTPTGTTPSGTYKVTYTVGGMATQSPEYNWTVEQPTSVKPVIKPVGKIEQTTEDEVNVQLELEKGKTGGKWGFDELPGGLVIDTTKGTITGKPDAAGDGKFTVRYTDPDGNAADPIEIEYSITAPATDPTLAYDAKDVKLGEAVTLTPTATNLGDSLTYTAEGLPTWLTLNADGTITGTAPDAEEDVSFTVTVTDEAGESATTTVTFKVYDPDKETEPTSVIAGNITGYVGENITPVTASRQGGTPGGKYKIEGTLPVGLTLNEDTGVISGKVDAPYEGTYKVSYTTHKGTYTKESVEYTIKITERPVNPYGPDDNFSSTYTLTYETNGGNNIGSERFKRGSVVTLTKIPVRAGYTFDGWYSDADLKNKIEKIEMDGNKTVYAGWKKTETPDVFDAEHFAYILGYPDGTVRPKNNITRAEVATIFYRLLSEQVRNENTTATNSFSDVNNGDWFNVAVSTMAKMGIINGYEDGTFRPQENITRAEFAAIASRFDTKNTAVPNADFADIEGHWGKIEISKAAMNGWITGDPTGNFRPNDKLTRAEAMAIINRVLNRVVESEEAFLPGMKTWSDNADKTMWYYLDVQEATNGHKHEVDENGVEKWIELLPNRTW